MALLTSIDWYTWSRDAALTYKVLIERFIHGDKSLKSKIDDYVSAQAELQALTNPSGGPDSGGLGEPKFNVNLTAFTGSWGRPQRDGPALRATALILYANWLVGNGARGQAADKVWPVIAKDLDYTTRFWNRTGYDLWEEINGSSFFTLSASHRALVEGTALAKTLGKTCNDCAASAPKVLCFMQSFWVGGYIDSNINVNDGRTGKDVNSIISSIHTFDPEADCTDATFQPCSARALANHKAVTDSFRTIYAVNKGIQERMTSGVIAGYPVVDAKVTLYDGSYHEVDSSEMAFKIAGSMAFSSAALIADPVLLEPMMKVEVVTPEDYMGDVMGDLTRRRGILQGMEDSPAGKMLGAHVPLSEMFGYATDLRSQTQGRATFTMEYDHYAEAPASVAEKIIKKTA